MFRIHGYREKRGRLQVRAERILGSFSDGDSARAVSDISLELTIESISIQEPTDARILAGDFEPRYIGMICRLTGRPPEELIGLEFIGESERRPSPNP